jgi:hypothetical protein
VHRLFALDSEEICSWWRLRSCDLISLGKNDFRFWANELFGQRTTAFNIKFSVVVLFHIVSVRLSIKRRKTPHSAG